MEFSIFACWCEPIETGVHESRRAREELIAGGDLSYAGYTYYQSATVLLDCAPSLDLYLAEVEAGLAFLRRTGDEQTIAMLDSSRWLADVLRGEGAAATAEAPVDRYAGNPLTLFHAHFTRAVAAAISGDPGGLARHTEAAMPLLPAAVGLYPTAVARLLRGLALADQARAAEGKEQADLLAELDDVSSWLAARAGDAPDNFLHLLRLIEAERARVVGDFRAAGLAYDAARREAARHQRPWHQALIAEHAARFYLVRGLDHAGYDLLDQARRHYLAWGATAKASELDWAYPALQTSAEATADDGGQPADLPPGRAVVTAGTIDLLGIVSASQALSSETSIDRLHARVVEVLSGMTGATGVHLLLWSEDRHRWLLPAPDSADNREGGTVPLSGISHERAVPMSVLRYARRTREPLVVADATRDDRFARDPYFAGADRCSLLAVPIVSRGTLRAVLLLENHLLRGAFTAGRLDAVKLIAGQLAVSLDNAQLYAEFRRIAGEQAALRRVAVLVAQAAPPEGVFGTVAAEAGRLLGVDFALLARFDSQDAITVVGAWTPTGAAAPSVGSGLPLGGQNVTTLVFRTGQAARTGYADTSGVIGDVAARDWGLRSSVGVPIRVEGRLWGVMIVALTHEELLPADTEAQLAGFTELVATAIANAQARTELHTSAEEQAALRRVATLVARAAPPGEVFAAVAEEAGRLLSADVAVLTRYSPDDSEEVVGVWAGNGIAPVVIGAKVPVGGRNVSSLVFQTSRSARIDSYTDISGPAGDIGRAAGVRASVGVPISVSGELWGVIIVATRSEPLPADTEARLAGFTELAATAVANVEARAEVTASRARIVAAADSARRRIERNLHDGAQQRLVSLALRLRAAQAAMPRELGAQLDHALAEATGALDELLEIARGIHPAILAERGLPPALKTLARRSPIPVDLKVQVKERLPEPVEVSAYYVIAEALTNAAKHARASTASVRIEVAGDVLLIAVRDDGAGGADFNRGTGLAGLKDRVEALGGRIVLDSPRGAGTSLRVELPLTTPTGQ
jgi:GAF domain-containing protein